MSLNDRGHEIPDTRPVQIAVPFRRPEPIHLKIRRMILAEVNRVRDADEETFADADDFDCGDGDDFTSPYEDHFDHIGDPPPVPEKELEKSPEKDSEKSDS